MNGADRPPKRASATQRRLPPEPIDWAKELEAWPWTFARTMAHIPHWYVVREKTVTAEEFDVFAEHIATSGYQAIWTSPQGR